MKYPIAHNTRGNPVSPIAAILMAARVKEGLQDLADNGITYVRFEYDNKVARLLQPKVVAKARLEPCDPSYWLKDHHVPVGRSHTHVHRTPRTYGSEALKLAMQAKVRRLMAERADARRAEWNALASIAA